MESQAENSKENAQPEAPKHPFQYFLQSNPWDYPTQKKLQRRAQKLAARQFVALYKKFVDSKIGDPGQTGATKFGFELETYHLKKVDRRNIQNLQSVDQELQTAPEFFYRSDSDVNYLQDPKIDFGVTREVGASMLELIPPRPFQSFVYGGDILRCFINMRRKLKEVAATRFERDDQEEAKFLWSPFMPFRATQYELDSVGLGQLTPEELAERNGISGSTQIDDNHFLPHPRYLTFTRCLLERKQIKQEVFYPLYKDLNTETPTTTHEAATSGEDRPGYVRVDNSLVGGTVSSLQVTLECADLEECRRAFDQLHFFSAILQALAAGTPIIRGCLVNTDTRLAMWNFSGDDRNPRERPAPKTDLKDPGDSEQTKKGGIPKPRSSPVNFYISKFSKAKRRLYNDNRYAINIKTKKLMKKLAKKQNLKIDEELLNHIAYNLVRENLTLVDDSGLIEDQEPEVKTSEMFRQYIRTNWNNLRFKPPPALDSPIGWRVEFRSMDAQISPEQNFLFCHAVLLLFRIVTDRSLGVDFRIPISLMDENFRRANLANAATHGRFYTRINVFSEGSEDRKPVVEELTVKEIFEGKGEFVGLRDILESYIERNLGKILAESSRIGADVLPQVRATFDFLEALASGEIKTNARRIREFVRSHQDYQKDSRINPQAMNGLVEYLLDLSDGNKSTSLKDELRRFIRC